jgi:hypothetical protein
MEEIIARVSQKSKIYVEFQNKSKKASVPLFVNDLCYAFFNLVKMGVSKKLQSFYGGPFIVAKKFSDALFELSPIGSNPIKSNQVISRDKIRKIDSKVDIFGETVSFNVFPVEEIVPSEEITLEVDNTHSTETEEQNSPGNIEIDDFTYLDYDNDDFESQNDSPESQEQGEELEGGGEIVENLPTYQPEGLKNPENPPETVTHAEQGFLDNPLPSETSFFDRQPEQSSPEKVINIHKESQVPKFLLEEKIKTRSQGGDHRIHVQIGPRNIMKRKK